jgi:hypothetical protein
VSLGMAISCGAGKRGFESRLSSILQRQEGLWAPSSLLCIGYRGCFPEDRAAWPQSRPLIAHPNLIPRSRMVELYIHFFLRFHTMVLKVQRQFCILFNICLLMVRIIVVFVLSSQYKHTFCFLSRTQSRTPEGMKSAPY